MAHGCMPLCVVVPGRPRGRQWVAPGAARHMPPPPACPHGAAGCGTPQQPGPGLLGCDTLCQGCAVLTQGEPAGLAGLRGRTLRIRIRMRAAAGALLLALTSPLAGAVCPGPALQIQRLASNLWWVPAATGDSDARNRGQVSNLVLVRDGAGASARWWALGSGPSPAWGRALACQLRTRLGARITDVISPWARPELVLGVDGLGGALAPRHWAHADVADAMAQQCRHCVDRLRVRLGAAASDLGDDPIRLPDQLLHGAQGRLGPFDWWRLPRADNRWVTVWRFAPAGAPVVWVAHGLLQGAGPPDGRDADLALLQQSSAQLAQLAAADGPTARHVGEQGPLLAADGPAVHARYWAGLLASARAAVDRGDAETAPAPGWPGDSRGATAPPGNPSAAPGPIRRCSGGCGSARAARATGSRHRGSSGAG